MPRKKLSVKHVQSALHTPDTEPHCTESILFRVTSTGAGRALSKLISSTDLNKLDGQETDLEGSEKYDGQDIDLEREEMTVKALAMGMSGV